MNAPVTASQMARVTYRAALTYHPNIGTFRGKRGAWRVHHCGWAEAPEAPRVCSLALEEGEPEVQLLYMDVPRMLHANTFINPTKLLRELLAQARIPSPTKE